MKREVKFIIGIDEVGRGPLAGPVAVGVAMATARAIKKFRTIKESKQLTLLQREAWYAKICAPESEIRFSVAFVSAKHIDEKGINPSIKKAMERALKELDPAPLDSRILLDGGLSAPPKYINQKTIIRGDAKETIIAIASVVAKVRRDRHMRELHKRYPDYGFITHVGYGTKQHREQIKAHGPSALHRITYLRNILPDALR